MRRNATPTLLSLIQSRTCVSTGRQQWVVALTENLRRHEIVSNLFREASLDIAFVVSMGKVPFFLCTIGLVRLHTYESLLQCTAVSSP